MNKKIVIYALLFGLGGGIFSVLGFLKENWEMCVIGLLWMFIFSGGATNERIKEISKEIKDLKEKINKNEKIK